MPPHEESHRLTRQLNLRDLVLTQILTVVGSAWSSGIGFLLTAYPFVDVVDPALHAAKIPGYSFYRTRNR